MTNIKFENNYRTCPRTCGSVSKGHVPDTNNNDNNIYLYLFNKYKSEIVKQNFNFAQKMKLVNECQQENNFLKLTQEKQNELFLNLMSLSRIGV